MEKRQKYILAVSGGVDSIVLLHKLASYSEPRVPQPPTPNPQPPIYIIAHFDHGIRDESASDARFVEELAKKYGLKFETEARKLGKGASEDEARDARYEFLFKVRKKYNAEAIITAHQQDDVLETMIINMIRGTGPRGLVGFSQPHILRPFLDKTKQELMDYAEQNKLKWREDSTNSDTKYLRNEIRLKIIPKMTAKRQNLIDLHKKTKEIYQEIDTLAEKILVQCIEQGELLRTKFVILPYSVQCEIMATWLRLNNVEIDKKMIARAVLAAKTMKPNKKVELSKEATLQIGARTIVLIVQGTHV